MKLSSKRLRRLQKRYEPRAKHSRLRLTSKRVRSLERERIKKGKSFEAVYRSYRKKRVAHSSARIAKKFGLSFKEAQELRTRALKEGFSYKELAKVKELPKNGLPISATNFIALYELINSIKDEIKKGRVPKEFRLSLSFGGKEYDGLLTGVSIPEFKKFGNDLFGEDESPWWGFSEGLVEGVIIPKESLTAVIHTELRK